MDASEKYQVGRVISVLGRLLQAAQVDKPRLDPPGDGMTVEDQVDVAESALAYWHRLVVELEGYAGIAHAELRRIIADESGPSPDPDAEARAVQEAASLPPERAPACQICGSTDIRPDDHELDPGYRCHPKGHVIDFEEVLDPDYLARLRAAHPGTNDPRAVSQAGRPSESHGTPSESPAPGGLRPSGEETGSADSARITRNQLAGLQFDEDRAGVNAREIGGRVYLAIKSPDGDGSAQLLGPEEAIDLGRYIEKVGTAILKRDQRGG